MNRRDFLRLAGLATLGIISPKKAGSMLPNSTNRFGDMLKDVLSGVQGIDQIKVDKLQQEMNDLWLRETKYRSWLRLQDNKIDFKNLALPFEPIYSTVLEDDKSELVIQIPSTYKHLQIMGQARVNNSSAATYVNVFVQFNGDTGASSYRMQNVWGEQATHGTLYDLTADACFLGYCIADGGSANHAGAFFATIPHYTNSQYYKILLSHNYAGEAAYSAVAACGSVWLRTDTIQTIRIYPAVANTKLEAGSLISVYGIF